MFVTKPALWVLLITTLFNNAEMFIFDPNLCEVQQPCECSFLSIECDNRSLTTMPETLVVNHSLSIMLDFQNNQLTTIAANSFINITLTHEVAFVELLLRNNNLTTIEKGAFNGVSNKVSHVDLTNNRFVTVPRELTKITQLETLYLKGNPISAISTTTFQNFATYFSHLSLDLQYFKAWPSELHFLRHLRKLDVEHSNATNLDLYAFDGFTDTLEELSIINSGLSKIPTAICGLKNLIVLHLSDNPNLDKAAGALDFCNGTLRKVGTLVLQYNQLLTMPDVFNGLPELTYLYLRGNNISYIDSDKVPDNSPLKYLLISHNKFTRIPFAVSKFKSLTNLNMQFNSITSIEESDLSGLSKLKYLHLNYNPIAYVSSNAFKNNDLLEEIWLQNTKIRVLPLSLTSLSRLENLYLYNNPTTCNCDMIPGYTTWNTTGLTILGKCASSSMLFKTYFEQELPKCGLSA